ncbi:hypothetical protein [Achromobacter marplatensis]|uniref:hypothetical protein n=1 Tax=Achromobacter marplatensis TaxID=470868 RepID=UPI0011783D3C|nr:hypothetical protein [Achromobacter marplatensis]
MKNQPTSSPQAEIDKTSAASEPAQAQSRTATVDQLIRTLSADLESLTRTKGELGLELVGAPKNPDVLERIDANEEQLVVVSRRLELYRQARVQAASQDEADRGNARVLNATTSRDNAVAAAQKRIKIAERLDGCFSQLAQAMRDWRNVNEEVRQSVHEMMQTVCEHLAGFDHFRQSKMNTGRNVSSRDFGANEILAALKRAGVDECTAGCVDLRPYGVWTVEYLANATLKAEAEREIPRIRNVLDSELRELSVGDQ